jgi:hypothetical protein
MRTSTVSVEEVEDEEPARLHEIYMKKIKDPSTAENIINTECEPSPDYSRNAPKIPRRTASPRPKYTPSRPTTPVVAPSSSFKTTRLPKGYKVNNVQEYINSLDENDEIVQEFSKDYQLPTGLGDWEEIRVMIDNALHPKSSESESESLKTESDDDELGNEVRRSAQSYQPQKVDRNTYRRIYNVSSKRSSKT